MGLVLAQRLLRELRLGLEAGDTELLDAAQQLDNVLDGAAFALRRSDPSLGFAAFAEALLTRLERELAAGRLVVSQERFESLTEHSDISLPELPPLPRAPREAGTHSFEVRFIDEIGKAISGVDAKFTADGPKTRATNAAGIALLDGVPTVSASVALLDPEALEKVLEPRWEKFRPGVPPKESNSQEVVFVGSELGPFALKAEVPNTIVIKPPLGKLFVELWDKTGRVRHANRAYQITGPQAFEGTTDDEGRLLHEDVLPGDYSLELTVELFKGEPDETVELARTQLVVLAASAGEPQIRQIGSVPLSVLATLRMFFNTNKAFLLPTALPSLQKLRSLYLDLAPCKVLAVGHADTKAGPSFNDPLSLQRAKAVVAYLKDEVQPWLDFYKLSDTKQCWGKPEDHLMIISLPDFVDKPKGENEVRWFQRTRKLSVDGTAGTQTRTQLISEYMALDGVSLADFAGQIEAVAHGCGENFPLDASGDALDKAPKDDKRDPGDRRVELFFFDAEFGISPAPPSENSGPGSPEYPLWRERVASIVALQENDPDAPKVTFVEMDDAHFRTDSAAVLPEGENPDDDDKHESLTSVGVIASALRFNDEKPGRSVLVAGHTDTAAGDQHNDELSKQRAQVALALLVGDRETFRNVASGRHKDADVNQILSWVSQALSSVGFGCPPKRPSSGLDQAALSKFQTQFNDLRDEIGSTADPLGIDGKAGPKTWGAFFDCYEFALRTELGTDAPGLAALRSKLTFADDDRKSLGFGERFPIEELGVDGFRSQTNRRVEILFFEAGEIPDLAHAEKDPETSEIYLPGHFERTPLKPRTTAKLNGNLNVYTHFEGEDQLDLEVRDEKGELVATFRKDAGTLSGSELSFALDPDNLPNPVSLAFRRDGELEDPAGIAEPATVRDDLAAGRLAEASELMRDDGSTFPDARTASTTGGASGSGAVPPAASDLRVIVKLLNPTHRLLKLTSISVTNSAREPNSTLGRGQFDIFNVTSFTLDVKLTSPVSGAGDLIAISVNFNVDRSKGAPRAILAPGQAKVHGLFVQGVHNGGVGVATMTLNFTFLDVTKHVRPQSPTFQNFESRQLNGCKVALFEHTGAAAPPASPRPFAIAPDAEAFTIAVVVPPKAVREKPFVNLLLFFMHELLHTMEGPGHATTTDEQPPDAPRDAPKRPRVPYVNSDDIDYNRLSKYLAPPPPKDAKQPAAPFEPSYVDLDITGSPTFDPFPNFNWSLQLAASGTPALLCMPFPKFTSFDVMNTAGRAEGLLLRLVTAMQASGVLPGKKLLSSVGIAGWSSGTKTLSQWLADTTKEKPDFNVMVEEAYFFDGRGDTKKTLVAGGVAELWFRKQLGRRLVLLGTGNTETESLALAKRLGNTEALDKALAAGKKPNTKLVRALPGRADYFYSGVMYQRALNLATPDIKLEFGKVGTVQNAPPENVTDESLIFLAASRKVGGRAGSFVELSFDDLVGNAKKTKIPGFSVEEAASVLHFVLMPAPRPQGTDQGFVLNLTEFDNLMNGLVDSKEEGERDRLARLRHPWSVMGGELRNGKFVGYLQFCLEQSGFT